MLAVQPGLLATTVQRLVKGKVDRARWSRAVHGTLAFVDEAFHFVTIGGNNDYVDLRRVDRDLAKPKTLAKVLPRGASASGLTVRYVGGGRAVVVDMSGTFGEAEVRLMALDGDTLWSTVIRYETARCVEVAQSAGVVTVALEGDRFVRLDAKTGRLLGSQVVNSRRVFLAPSGERALVTNILPTRAFIVSTETGQPLYHLDPLARPRALAAARKKAPAVAGKPLMEALRAATSPSWAPPDRKKLSAVLHRQAEPWKQVARVIAGDDPQRASDEIVAMYLDAEKWKLKAGVAPNGRLALLTDGVARLDASFYAWRHLASFQRLDLEGDDAGYSPNRFNAHCAKLATCNKLTQLEELRLYATGTGDKGFVALVGSRTLAHLRELHVCWEALGGKAVNALAGADLSLEALSLDFCFPTRVTKPLQALAQAAWTSGIRRLSLRSNDLGAKEIEVLVDTPLLRGVESLSLGALEKENPIGDEGAKLLAECAALSALRELDLTHCAIGKKGAKALAKSKHLGRLRQVWVEEDSPARAVLAERFRVANG